MKRCPKCGAEAFDKDAKCRSCGNADFTPAAVSGTKKCPYCAEEIQAQAVVCRHCGRDLVAGISQRQTTAPAPSGGSFWTAPLGCGGCLVVCVIAGLLFAGYCATKVAELPKPGTTPAAPRVAPTDPKKMSIFDMYEAASRDVKVEARCALGGFGNVALWRVTLRNTSKTITYKDIHYRSSYVSESGNTLATHEGIFQIVLKPGQSRGYEEFNDGLIPSQVKRCGMDIYGGTAE